MSEENVLYDVEVSKEQGVALEVMAYGIVTFDPQDVEGPDDDRMSTVGGQVTLFLTEQDVHTLMQHLATRISVRS